ncbi:MAG: type II toxin-antitoxin system VapC family toxin [bacterium]|nr:type II toxin-antitoxin system VapC family toxin [bacterium]
MNSDTPLYILDTSIVVKWYSSDREADLDKAHDIFDELLQGFIDVIVPDLLIYELSNSLLKSKKLSDIEINEIIERFYSYLLSIKEVNSTRIKFANELAYQHEITTYDAIYLSLAKEFSAPLVSSNPRHHKSISQIQVINLTEWKG